MKIRSAVPENGCLVFFDGRKKQKNNKETEKKQKKTSVKHIHIRLIGGDVNYLCLTAKFGEDILNHGRATASVEDFQYGGFDALKMLAGCRSGPFSSRGSYARVYWSILPRC